MHELLEPQVGPEASLGYHIVSVPEGQPVGHYGVAAVGDIAEGAGMHDYRLALAGLN